MHKKAFVLPPQQSVGLSQAEKTSYFRRRFSVLALPIFPASHPASIVGANELNFCVRDGNRWTLAAINTNYGAPSGTRTRDPLIKSQLLYQLS